MAPNSDIATRSLVVALKSPLGGHSTSAVSEATGISVRTVNNIYARAIERGFDPNRLPLTIKDEWLEDAPRSGRPTKQTDELKEAISTKCSWAQRFSDYRMAYVKKTWVQEDETDAEAWVDEEDER